MRRIAGFARTEPNSLLVRALVLLIRLLILIALLVVAILA